MKNRNPNRNVGLVHIGEKEKSGIQILEKLRQHDFQVIEWNYQYGDENKYSLSAIETIVINIGSTEVDYDNLLNSLMEQDIKVIINEAKLTNDLTGIKRQRWERHLLNKIDSFFSLMPATHEDKPVELENVDLSAFNIKQVWILAASIGGPVALKEFLQEFKGNEDLLFIMIQHMDEKALIELGNQLNIESKILLINLISGMKVQANRCIIHPGNEFVQINNNGVIELKAITKKLQFYPCIDATSIKLSKNIKDVNIAVFSGMSTDGIEAAVNIKNLGGQVITQSEDSCVLSTIVSGIKKRIEIDFEGFPSQMANYIKNR